MQKSLVLFVACAAVFTSNAWAATSQTGAATGDARKACCDCTSSDPDYNSVLEKCPDGYRKRSDPTTYYTNAAYDATAGTTQVYNRATAGSDQCTAFPPSTNLPMDGVNRFCGDMSAYSGSNFFQINKQQAPLCVVVGYDDGTNKFAIGKFQWWVTTDKFQLLDLYNSFKTNWFDNAYDPTVTPLSDAAFPSLYTRSNMVFQVEFGGKVSALKHRWDKTLKYVVPYWTIVIDITSGTVNTLTFDDGCFSCTTNTAACVDNTCGLYTVYGDTSSANQCIISTTANISCDFKLYVAWSGNDKNNDYCISSGMKPSQFTKYSAAGVLSQAAKTASYVNDVATTITGGSTTGSTP
jgi:hypothetical protein